MPDTASPEILFESQPRELDAALTPSFGAVPDGLVGTVYRNGAGVLQIGDDPLHLLDGHGMIGAVTFDAHGVRIRTRHVRTPWFLAEQQAGKQLYRRIFTNMPNWSSNVGNVELAGSANHDVFRFGDRLVATEDGGWFTLDPHTLQTRGQDRWDGAIPAGAKVSPMPRIDPATNTQVAYYVEDGQLVQPDHLTFAEIGPDGGSVQRMNRIKLTRSPFILHDLAFTQGWYLVNELPVALSALAALAGFRPVLDAFDWSSQGALWMVSRPGGRVLRLELPAQYKVSFHIANAYEHGGDVVVDLCCYDTSVKFGSLQNAALRRKNGVGVVNDAPPKLVRLVIDPEQERIREVGEFSLPIELPEVAASRFGQMHRYVWGATPGEPPSGPAPGGFPYFHGVGCIDTDTGVTSAWSAGPNGYCSQPAFAARPGRDPEAGWLLTFVLDAQRRETDLVVLDAADLSAGPVCRVPLGAPLPAASHVTWSAA